MKISAEVTGQAAQMRAELAKRAVRARRINEAVGRAAEKLRGRAQAHSRGRPGPNIITGAFHDSWTYAAGAESATVANGSVQAARLEFGFVGVDAIGRHYNQPPYPSLAPAVAESETLLGDELEKVLLK